MIRTTSASAGLLAGSLVTSSLYAETPNVEAAGNVGVNALTQLGHDIGVRLASLFGITTEAGICVGYCLTLLALIVAAYLAGYGVRFVMSIVLKKIDAKSEFALWDLLTDHRFALRFSRFVPLAILYAGAPEVVPDGAIRELVESAVAVYFIVICTLFVSMSIGMLGDGYRRFSRTGRDLPIRGFIQATRLVVFALSFVLILSELTNKSPSLLLGSLTALTAVLMLVFKDTILGLVAGIQIATNRLVRVGDWIEMPQFGADGNVIEVSLNTVKVRNWDLTVTTIPSYALISQSFKNWRGMSESSGRRIKRHVQVDMNSVRFCDDEMIERFRRIELIRDYIDHKLKDIAIHNRGHKTDDSAINGRQLTNLGTFRAYLAAYLREHPLIHQGMTLLVRQLPLSEMGVPIEVYVFSNDKVWANYEDLQSDIFDHILATLPVFGLRPFQFPTELPALAMPRAS